MAKKTKKKTTRKKARPTQPRMKAPPLLFNKTQKVIGRLAESVEGTFLTYWTSENGSICDNDVQALNEVLHVVQPEETINLFVKSAGGDGQSALRIIHLLRQHGTRLNVLIPLECASAGTMLALGADEIHMGPLSFLTPIDTSLEHSLGPVDPRNESATVGHDELQRAVALWAKQSPPNDVNPYQELYKYLHPLVVGAVDRATSLSIRLCNEILRYHMTDEAEAEKIAEALNSEYPSHEYPITSRSASNMGLNIRELDPEINELLLDLNHLYAEMGQRAVTDSDEFNYHNNEIVNIIEGPNVQLFYQNDKDWHYRKEERQWVSLNVESCWHRSMVEKGRVRRSKIYLG